MYLSDEPRLFGPQCPDLTPVATVHENPWFTVKNRGGFYTTEPHAPQVYVLAIVNNSHIVMVRVRRPVVGDSPLELPAGGVEESDKSLAHAAARELQEETGIGITDFNRLQPLQPIAGSPGRNPMLLAGFIVHLTLDEFEALEQTDVRISKLIRADDMVTRFEAVQLDDFQSSELKFGRAVKLSKMPTYTGEEDWLRLYAPQDVFMGLGKINAEGLLAPKRLFV